MNRVNIKVKKNVLCAIYMLCGVGFAYTGKAQEYVEIHCSPATYGVGYFNGIRNSPEFSFISLEEVKSIIGEKDPNDVDIHYDLFINKTNGLLDIAEVFLQKADEIDADVSEKFWELFWYARGDQAAANEIVGQIDEVSPQLGARLRDFLSSLHSEIGTTLAGELSEYFANEPVGDYSRHRAKVNTWRKNNLNALFVAHSQGNLFVNEAYDHAISPTGAGYSPRQVKVVHVAPASVELSGPYVLSSSDIVINVLLRAGALGADIVPRPNVTVDLFSEYDRLGHGFVPIYLNPKTGAYEVTKALILSQWNSLLEGDTAEDAFEVTMTWPEGVENLSLWVREPNGTELANADIVIEIFGTSGELAPDFVSGPEVYSATCDPDTLEGEYRFFDANRDVFSRFSNPFELEVESSGRVFFETVGSTVPGKVSTKLGIFVQKMPDSPNFPGKQEKFRITTFGF